jgi:integrase
MTDATIGFMSGSTENPLTEMGAISYLLHERSEIMDGSVRVRGKCPVCQGAFKEIPKLGFICPEHHTTPKRYLVDFFYGSKRYRLYSDRHGQILDSFQRATNLLSRVNSEIRDHTFDPTHYLKSELEKYYVSVLLDKFLESKLTGDRIAPSYKRHYWRYVGIAKEHFGIRDVRDLRKLDILNYQSYVRENYNFSDKTLKNCVDVFKTFLRYVKGDLELVNIVPSFPEINVPEPKTTWLTPETQKVLFGNVPDVDKPIIAFLMLSGCRTGEARALKCRDVNIEHKRITISATFSGSTYREKRKGQGAKKAIIPIHPEVFEFIKQRVENNLPEAFVFVSDTGRHYSAAKFYRMWDAVREKSGLDKSIRLYDAARHSFASQLINSGVSIYSVSHLLGHSNIKTTEKYLHNNLQKLEADVCNLSLDKKVIKLGDSVPGKAVDQKL